MVQRFKVNVLGYDFLTVMYLVTAALWLLVVTVRPMHGAADWVASLRYLGAGELMWLLCSPLLRRKVTIDDMFITESWHWWTVDRLPVSEVRTCGLCVTTANAHVRQYIYLSNRPVTDDEVCRLYEERRWKRKGFFTVDHPQKALDDCIAQLASRAGLSLHRVIRDGTQV